MILGQVQNENENKKRQQSSRFIRHNGLRFFRDFARKKWPLRATRGEVSSRILQFRILLICVYRFPDHGDKTKKGRA
jgi:hypothetical protein